MREPWGGSLPRPERNHRDRYEKQLWRNLLSARKPLNRETLSSIQDLNPPLRCTFLLEGHTRNMARNTVAGILLCALISSGLVPSLRDAPSLRSPRSSPGQKQGPPGQEPTFGAAGIFIHIGKPSPQAPMAKPARVSFASQFAATRYNLILSP